MTIQIAIATALLIICGVFLSIIIHAMFFKKDDINNVEINKEELIEWIKKCKL
jgi:hypothetical protein